MSVGCRLRLLSKALISLALAAIPLLTHAAEPLATSGLPLPGFNVQSWRPGVGLHDGMLVRSAIEQKPQQWSTQLQFNYTRLPLRLVNNELALQQALVGDLAMLDLGASVGWQSGWLFGVALPVAGVIRSGGANLAQVPLPKGPAMGDLRLELRNNFAHVDLDGGGSVHVGVAVVGDVPTASRGSFIGGAGAVGGELVASALWQEWRGDVNLGARWQPTQQLNVLAVDGNGQILAGSDRTTIMQSGSHFIARAGLMRPVMDGELRLRGELQLLTSLISQPIPAKQALIDLAVGADYKLAEAFRAFVSFSGSPSTGLGAAQMRAVIGLQFEPGQLPSDQDGDGLDDKIDKCPQQAEDKDGFEDADGCPDPDNDADGLVDAVDNCPLQPEDKDGFQDEDGCPDPDNDGDGILDANDRCPNDAEDFDGFDDNDGCPEWDNDKDGILDKDDLCPNAAENKNGFEDDDGCPDTTPRREPEAPVTAPAQAQPAPAPAPPVGKPALVKEKPAPVEKPAVKEKPAPVEKPAVKEKPAPLEKPAEKPVEKPVVKGKTEKPAAPPQSDLMDDKKPIRKVKTLEP